MEFVFFFLLLFAFFAISFINFFVGSFFFCYLFSPVVHHSTNRFDWARLNFRVDRKVREECVCTELKICCCCLLELFFFLWNFTVVDVAVGDGFGGGATAAAAAVSVGTFAEFVCTHYHRLPQAKCCKLFINYNSKFHVQNSLEYFRFMRMCILLIVRFFELLFIQAHFYPRWNVSIKSIVIV